MLEDLLKEQGDQHEAGDTGRPAEKVHPDPTAHAGIAEQARRQDGVGRPLLDQTEPDHARDGERQSHRGPPTESSPLCGADSTPPNTTATAAPVTSVAPVASNGRRAPVPSGREEHPARNADGGRDRSGDEEHALPAECRGETSPPTVTPAAPPTVDAAPQPLIARARPGPVKRARMTDMAAGLSIAAPDALHQPCGDQHGIGCREPAEERAGDQHAGAEEEHPPPPEDVRGTTRDQQKAPRR